MPSGPWSCWWKIAWSRGPGGRHARKEARRSPRPLPGIEHLEPRNLLTSPPLLIGLNSPVQGTVETGQVDRYQLQITDSGRLDAQLTATAGSTLQPRLTLSNGVGQALISSDAGPEAPAAALAQPLDPGTYQLDVSAQAGMGGYELTTSFTTASPPLKRLPVGDQARSVVAADVNGDHIPDLVTANYSGNTVSVLLGNGDGSFQPQQTFQVGYGPTALAVADVNGDGKPDLVVANYGANTVSVLLGNGDASFQLQQTFQLAAHPTALAVADVNGDGTPDLIVAGYDSLSYSGSITVLLGQGDGSFQAGQTVVVSLKPVALTVADVNGDGTPDLVSASQGRNADPGAVTLLLGNGDGTFSARPPLPAGRFPSSVAVADLNHDGIPDVVATNSADGQVTVLLGQGKGSFLPGGTFEAGPYPGSVVAADLNGDGRPDLVLSDSGGQVAVLLNNGDGSFQAPRFFYAGPDPGTIAVADLNGDGRPDLAVVNKQDSSVAVLLGNGDGSFLTAPAISAGPAPGAVAVANLNGDGRPDLVTANLGSPVHPGHTVGVLLGNGAGSFQPQQTFATGRYPRAVALADVNGDGRPDLVVANQYDNTGSVLLGNGDGSFQPQQTFQVGAAPRAVAVADLNGDGKCDVIVANYGDNTVSVLLGKGDGTFGPPRTFATGVNPVAVAVADLDGNGKPDLVVANQYDKTVSILLGQGDGTFAPQQTIQLSFSPGSVLVADVNGDGKKDLVVTNPISAQVTVLLSQGNGLFGPPQSYTAGYYVSALAVADVNGDGRPDLITTDSTHDRVSVLLGNGDGSFGGTRDPLTGRFMGAPLTFAVGSDPVAVAVADVNGDGKKDLVVANRLGNTLSVLLGQGDGTFVPAPPRNVPLRDTPLLADLDGDPQHTLDAVTLDQRSGTLLFRPGLPGPSKGFGPPQPVNPGHPALDATLVRTNAGWAIAAADASSNTVSLYRLANGSFSRTQTFVVGGQPVRIATADLQGSGRDDLVIVSGSDGTVTVALQTASGQFLPPSPPGAYPLSVGVNPSDIAFTDVNGDKRPDIVVTGQGSGDVTVLLNDAAHSFTTSYHFRTAAGLYSLDSTSGNPASLAEPVSLAVGDFTGNGTSDLVVVNRRAHSLSVLPGDGQGGFANPQQALSISTSDFDAQGKPLINDQPGPVVAGDFNGDGSQDLAVLMEDTAQVWVFLGDGHGHFTHAFTVPAGVMPTGLARVPGSGSGPFDLLVGNQFGDVLRLVGQADGSFRPLFLGQGVPFVTADLSGHGQQDVVLVNQSRDRVLAQIRNVGTSTFQTEGISQPANGLQSPGALALADLNGDGLPDLMVADSGSNQVLVYLGTSPGHFSTAPLSFNVGDAPAGMTVADLNGDGVPDLVVANQGSNDVSVLLGQGQGSNWTLTPGPRLAVGKGPISVAVRDATGDGIPDLLVTNAQDGTVTLLPGIGSGGRGTGFFNDLQPITLQLPGGTVPGQPEPTGQDAITQTVIPASPGTPALALTQDGSIYQFNPDNLTQPAQLVFTSPGDRLVTALTEGTVNGTSDVVAARSDNTLSVLAPDAQGQLAESLVFRDARLENPSALEVVDVNDSPEIYVTNAGQDALVVLPFTEGTLANGPFLTETRNGLDHTASREPLDQNPGNPGTREVGSAPPLFPFNPAEDGPLPTFNTGQFEGGTQRGETPDLQPLGGADLALAATLLTGPTAEVTEPAEPSGLTGSFVVGLDPAVPTRPGPAPAVDPSGGPDAPPPADGATRPEGGGLADQPAPLADFVIGLDEAIASTRPEPDPGPPDGTSSVLNLERLRTTLDTLFRAETSLPPRSPAALPAFPADPHLDGEREAVWVFRLAEEALGLTVPAPFAAPVRMVLDQVAAALKPEQAAAAAVAQSPGQEESSPPPADLLPASGLPDGADVLPPDQGLPEEIEESNGPALRNPQAPIPGPADEALGPGTGLWKAALLASGVPGLLLLIRAAGPAEPLPEGSRAPALPDSPPRPDGNSRSGR